LSLFGSAEQEHTSAEGDNKMVEDLKEIRKFLEELYNQLEEN
jgi:hypothetical protein